jgi:hypothetical protein
MYLKYGNYQHAAGEVSVTISRQGLFGEGGMPRGVRERWDVQGRLQAADQASLHQALGALVAAYGVQGQDVGFFFDNGQPSSHQIVSSATLGGVRVVVPPSFPDGKGAEYSTYRSYTLALEAEWLDENASLVSWIESLTFQGGGEQVVFLEPIQGLPQKQLLKQATTYRVTQAGEAVGYRGYPLPAAPIWPAAEHRDRRMVRYDLPRRSGPPGSPVYTDYRVSWSYSFEDSGPLVAAPTSWPL